MDSSYSDRPERPVIPLQRSLVLVADPDPRIRELLRLAFTPAGYSCHEAATDAAVLALAQRDLPATILLDTHLPDLGGFHVLRLLRQRPELAGCRILMFSADCDPAIEAEARRLGADFFVTKPYRPTRLVSLMESPPVRVDPSPTGVVTLPRPRSSASIGSDRSADSAILEFPSGRRRPGR